MSANAFAALRIAYALGLIAAPGRVAGRWLGKAAGTAGGAAAVRGLAARDLVLSLGVVAASRGAGSSRPWLVACAVSDLADVGATLAVDPAALPSRARTGTLALAGGSALTAAALALRAR